jgi:peptidoglycan/xylan/chitin deacetylase (PgdA/CDA1 family)
LAALALLSDGAASAPLDAAACKGTLYLTLDTGNMVSAEHIAEVLARHRVKATFFLANERTYRDDFALDQGWSDYWKARVDEGHAFGSHTWRHWYFRADRPDGSVFYQSFSRKESESLDRDGVCREIGRVDERFAELTGRHLDPYWRAPGGRTTPQTLKYAASCGFPDHVHWADAGFLGDELPSESYSNAGLLAKALKSIRGGDILMMHLGIWSRKERFADVFEPLIVGLQDKGFCFATLLDRDKAKQGLPDGAPKS